MSKVFGVALCLLAGVEAFMHPVVNPALIKRDTAGTPERERLFQNLTEDVNLKWGPCSTEKLEIAYECARLSVPLDYNKPENGLRAIVPIIKAPAAAGFPYKGSVLFNPGGPGALGTETLYDTEVVKKLRKNIFGEGWDIVGFDPRGLGYSIPYASCALQPDTLEVDRENATTTTIPKLRRRSPRRNKKRVHRPIQFSLSNSTNTPSKAFDLSFGMRVARDAPSWKDNASQDASSLAAQCLNYTAQYNQAGPHMNSVVVATDMLSIAKAIARGKEEPEDSVLVNFYGISYGTILGQYFASLYPDHVGKIFLDGVVDAETWIAKHEENTTTLHVDEGWSKFFPLCHEAGSKNCSFATGDSADDIRTRFNSLMVKLDATKFAQENHPEANLVAKVLDKTKQKILNGLYTPHRSFRDIADYLTYIEPLVYPTNPSDWDSAALLNGVPPSLSASGATPPSNSSAQSTTEPPPAPLDVLGESFNQVACTDARDLRGTEITAEEENAWLNSSKIAGFSQIPGKIACLSWSIRPSWEWFGPIGGTTATPMLFAGNLFDPITPYDNAKKATSLFRGAQMIYVDEVGHSTMNTKNECAFNHARQYFQDGTMPGNDVRCSPGPQPLVN
ncbi:hypothetical protein TWF694_000406 [Orbilia ellipsospora]|uniref:Peptidase S33 tripeptidyl aminopeptidase-like C-terminal domain-containing protein n=1 Tax=Orbilia ellipsospora TaxID=2528407 RepID=A0AAV9XNL0_9PEZI